MNTPHNSSFTRTGGVWTVLLIATGAWLATSVWAFRVANTASVDSQSAAESEVTDSKPSSLTDAQVAMSSSLEEQSIAKAPASANPSNSSAQTPQSETKQAEVAEQAAAEQAAAEQAAAEQAAAEQAAAEQAAAEQAAAEQAAAEQAAAEQAAAEQAAAEQAAAEQAAAEQAAAEQAAAEEAALAEQLVLARNEQIELAQSVSEQSRLAEGQKASDESIKEQQAQDAAAEEARRVALAAQRLTAQEQLRADELSVLSGLSARLRFENRSEVIDRGLERTLDRMFDPLFLYPEMPVLITVSTNEFRGVADNNRLSNDRALAVVDYLVSRGLEPDRFRVETIPAEELTYGTHRIKVSVEEPAQ